METEERTQAPVAKRGDYDFTDQLVEPFSQLRTEVDKLFESFPFRLPAVKFGRFSSPPALEMSETDKNYKITAELPGIEPGDVEVTFDDGILRITGEKKEIREENERNYRLTERSYGAFERAISIPSAADPKKIEADFKNGILTITIAKNGAEKKNVRKIKIGREA